MQLNELAPRVSPEYAEILGEIFSVGRNAAAERRVHAACENIPIVQRYATTPQTPPDHGEGPWVIDHIVRLFTVIDAFEHGVTLAHCTEVGADTVFRLALMDAERAVASSPDMFRAFALMHNIAKPDRLRLIAEPGTAGEKEGFARLMKRSEPYSTAPELTRFDKLRRAGLAEGIVATFDDADRAVIAPQYAEAREAIVRYCGLEHAFVKFLTELCWSHEDIATYFANPGNESAFATFPARAGKAGINGEKYLDALLAIALIDHDLGRLRSSAQATPFHTLHTLALAECAVMPERHAAREARQRHAEKLRIKTILGEAGLDPEIVFKQLGVGLGPERGDVMHRIYAVIRGEADASSFGEHAISIEARARRAAELLAKEGLSV